MWTGLCPGGFTVSSLWHIPNIKIHGKRKHPFTGYKMLDRVCGSTGDLYHHHLFPFSSCKSLQMKYFQGSHCCKILWICPRFTKVCTSELTLTFLFTKLNTSEFFFFSTHVLFSKFSQANTDLRIFSSIRLTDLSTLYFRQMKLLMT